MAKKKIDIDKYASGLFLRTEQYADKVRQHYATAVDELLKLSANRNISHDELFSFSDNKKLSEKANNVLRGLYSAVYNEIKGGVMAEWEFANLSCDALIESIFGKGLNENNHFARWFSRNQEAMDAFFKRKSQYGGMNLSQKVWKYTGDLKTEMELALSLSLGQGDSASTVSRKVRQYLQEPDKLFRRIKTGTDADGNPLYKLSKAAKAYHPGRGVYRSSYKNAMRLTRTETNMAYRASEQDRWQRMDFVVGYEVKRSKRGFDCKVCEALKGKYPKDFVFRGWHAQCRCVVVPILATDDEFIKMQEKILADESPTSIRSVNTIRRPNQNFYDWWEENKGRVETATTMPYWVQDNQDYINKKRKIRVRTDEEREAIRKKWAERSKKYQTITKMANNVLKVAQDYGEVDYSLLQKYIDAGDLSGMQSAVKVVAAQISTMKKEEKALSALIPDAHKWHKTFTLAELQKVYDSVEAKLAKFSGLTLEEQKKQLAKEIKYVEDPTFLKPHTQYPTWKVSQAAYIKQLDAVNYKIAIKPIVADLEIVKKWSDAHPKSLNVAKFLADAQAAVANGDDIVIIQQKASLAINEHQKRLAEQARRDAKKGAVVFSEMNKKTIDKLLKDYDNNTVDAMDDSLRPLTEAVWATLTDEEKVVLTKYTQSYSYLNEPLRGLSYYGGRTQKEYDHDMPILTSALNKFKTVKDMVVRRGTGNYYIPELGKDLSGVSVGDTFTDGAFLSTACHRNKGFSGDVNMIILVPKGARGAFAEPFSHYTDSFKFDYNGTLWDGKSKETIEQEFEWIGQRGSRFKVIKVDGRNIYLQMIGQLR